MRPLRLELEGFMGWRRRQVLDLEGVDLCAFVGPTGAGKSSLIEAMTFALYGVAPRLEDRRQVAPVVSQGAVEARVRLDFVVDGIRYTAVRVVHRTGERKATTREARLERGDEVLAGDAEGVTDAVERVLGLGVDHFVRCVMLPQGEFARVLHDPPKDRDALLKELLGAGVYERVRVRAYEHAHRLRAGIEAIDAQLEGLRSVPERLQGAEERMRRLEEVEQLAADEGRGLALLDEEIRRERDRQRSARERAARLRDIRYPSEVSDLARRLEAAKSSLAEAMKVEGDTQQKVHTLRQRLSDLPPPAELRARIVALEQVRSRRARVEQIEVCLRDREEEWRAADEACREAREQLEKAQTALSEAEDAKLRARQKLEALPSEERIQSDLRALEELELRRRVALNAEAESQRAEDAFRAAEARYQQAEARSSKERAALEHVRLLRAVTELARGLRPGDPCPVCGRPIEAAAPIVPSEEVTEAQRRFYEAEESLREAERALQSSRGALATTQEALRSAREELVRAQQRAGNVRPAEELHRLLEEVKAARESVREAERRETEARKALADCDDRRRAAERLLAEVRERLSGTRAMLQEARRELSEAELTTAGLPPVEELQSQLRQAQDLQAALAEAERAAQQARQRREEADQRLQQIREEEQAAWQGFQRARDSVADCGPPLAEGQLREAWEHLCQWASMRAAEEEKTAEEAARRLQECEEERQQRRRSLLERLAQAGVGVGPDEDPRVAATRAAEAARADVRRLQEQVEEAGRLRGRRERVEAERLVTAALERELRSDRFPRWVLDEALEGLVEGATRWLRDLSRGRYSLDIDRATREVRFVVVDHANADQRRPVRTLSGGETFLASLSLALALGSHLASLTARPGALETLFLDEGFGTLDPESLDVVASALEELAAGERMVGIVTHVPEVAERVPVRFDVRPGPNGPTLERVDV